MIKIVITGPESSGKTTLAEELALHYKTAWVPEYARIYLNQLDRPYREEDLLEIAQGQVQQEDEAARLNPRLLVCDTSLLVVIIWSTYRYGHCHPWIEEQWRQRPVDHYLLCRPDLPWQPDPQRENPHNRDELFVLYQRALQTKPHKIIEGNEPTRLGTSIEIIDSLLSN